VEQVVEFLESQVVAAVAVAAFLVEVVAEVAAVVVAAVLQASAALRAEAGKPSAIACSFR
jgi:hypothetical protein